MNKRTVSSKVLLYFLMLMLMMVTVGCSKSDDTPAPPTSTYTVTFDSQSATTAAAPTSLTVTLPATTVGALPTAPTRTSYNFAGWYTSPSGGGAQFTASTPVTASITVYAKWTTSDVYTVTYDSQSGSSVAPQLVVSGETVVTLPAAPTKTGYNFGSWNTHGDGSGTAFIGTTVVTGNITVYAQWASYDYTVTYDSQSGSAVSPQHVISPATTVVTLPAAPTRTSYTFAGWWTGTGGTGTQFTASTPVTASIPVYAYWTTSTVYTVTFDSQGGTAVSPQQVVSGGTVGTLPADPTRTGFTFGGWYTATSGGGTQFTGTTVVTGNIPVYAKWTATGTAASAAGTFTYSAGTLTLNWTSVNFPCNGPTVGSEVDPVTITTTTMTMGDMTWTRSPAGAANDPAGTWTSTDDNGNSYTLVVAGTASGSVSVTANIVTCTWLETYHSTGDYGVWTGYNDAAHAVTSVSLTGTGISGSQALTYSTSDADWSYGVDFGASPPAFPYTYNFTITKGTSWVETATISCFVETLPTVTAPGATVTTATPTFSWNAVANALQYQVKVYDGSSEIWSSDKTTSLSIVYNSSTPLTTGKSYSYQVIVRGNTACPKGQSYTQGNFTTSF